MRIPAFAEFAYRIPPLADTGPHLIHYYALAWNPPANASTERLNGPTEFMPHNLRHLLEWDGQLSIIEVVIGMSSEDVEVCSAHADSVYADSHFVRARISLRNFAERKMAGLVENERVHRLPSYNQAIIKGNIDG
jgi:hypothetical protein